MVESDPQVLRADMAVHLALNLQKALDSPDGVDGVDFPLIPREALRPVRPAMGDGERMLASGGCVIKMWGAPGDGTFQGVEVPFVLTGFGNREGRNMILGAAGASMAINYLGARRAQKDGQPRWMEFVRGPFSVSTHGVYIETAESGVLGFSWGDFQSMEWMGQSVVECSIFGGEGASRLVFLSEWAELMFVLWVHYSFPDHPQKYRWIDAGWVQRTRERVGFDPLEARVIRALGH